MKHDVKSNQSDSSQQDKQYRLLQAAADQLKSLHDRLQKEKAQLLQHEHLSRALAAVLGAHRVALQHDDDVLCGPTADAHRLLCQLLDEEQQLLQQLQGFPSVDAPTDSGCDSTSPADAADLETSVWRQSSLDDELRQNSGSSMEFQFLSDDSLSAHHSGDVVPPQPVAPDHDPFMLLSAILDQPFEPTARTITLPELRARWSADVQLLSSYLQQLEADVPAVRGTSCCTSAAEPETSSSIGGGPSRVHSSSSSDGSCGQAAATQLHHHQQQQLQQWQQRRRRQEDVDQAIRNLQMQQFGMTNSLSDVDRVNLFVDLQLANWHTGERLQEPCKQRHAAALRAMQLTPAQKERLVAGTKFFQRLLNPLVTERQQRHMQGVHITSLHDVEAAQPSSDTTQRSASVSGGGACDAAAAAAAAAAAVGSCSLQAEQHMSVDAPASSARTAEAAPSVVPVRSAQGERLHAQSEQVNRLRVLAAKDRLLRGAQIAYILGCMSWVQQAKLRVAMSPWNVNMGVLMVVLMEEMQREQQQQHNRGPQGV